MNKNTSKKDKQDRLLELSGKRNDKGNEQYNDTQSIAAFNDSGNVFAVIKYLDTRFFEIGHRIGLRIKPR